MKFIGSGLLNIYEHAHYYNVISSLTFEILMKEKNSTFRGGNLTWANACVGNNGSPSYVEYALGFSKAANLLIDQVLSSRDNAHNVDDFVYPVCFNMRHSVELRLKGAITELEKIAKIKGINLSFDLVSSHNIGNIWSFFKRESENIDNRYEDINANIEPTILDIAEVDPTGQTFRYPTDIESEKHLTGVALINFVVLKEKFSKLQENLDRLLSLNDYLIEEYSLNTFTSRLSRQQLFRLSEDLPEIHSWRNECFRQKKLELREKYNLSSNDLTRAIDIIKINYELMHNLGSRLPLQGLDEYSLIWFLDFWVEINSEINYINEGSGYVSADISSIMKFLEKEETLKSKFWMKLNGQLTPEVLAGLKALFYFARDKKFSETYIHTYQRELKEAEFYSREGIDGIKESFMHLADKANFFENLVISLYFLHYDELAEELMEIYGFCGAFHWLDKAKSRSMFDLPEFAGY